MLNASTDSRKCPSLESNFFSPKLMLAQYTVVNICAVLIATPEAALSLVQIIYCAGGIEDIKNNLVHYAYSEVSSLTKSFFTSVS